MHNAFYLATVNTRLGNFLDAEPRNWLKFRTVGRSGEMNATFPPSDNAFSSY
jgi:hypothetical protein